LNKLQSNLNNNIRKSINNKIRKIEKEWRQLKRML
jgi:hypothetical protein